MLKPDVVRQLRKDGGEQFQAICEVKVDEAGAIQDPQVYVDEQGDPLIAEL